MHSRTLRYARNGSLAAIALYLMIIVPLLGLSLQSPQVPVAAAVMQPNH